MSAKPPQIIDVVAERLRRRATMQAPVVDAELHQYSNAYSLIGFAQYCSRNIAQAACTITSPRSLNGWSAARSIA